jgi:ATP-dependent helicase/nuclease subunit B
VQEHWPAILAERGMVDASQHQELRLQALMESWQKNPPQGPVIIAGSTGSLPATRRMMQAVLQLPQGWVMLPFGIPCAMERPYPPTHPHAAQARICEALGIRNPEDLPIIGDETPHIHRRELVRLLMERRFVDSSQLVEHVHLVEAESPQAEAESIALLMLEAMHEGICAPLVTRDRGLAQRVAHILAAAGHRVQDSAAISLAQQPAGRCMLRVLDWLMQPKAPIAWLELAADPAVDYALQAAGSSTLRQGLEYWLRDHDIPLDEPEGLAEVPPGSVEHAWLASWLERAAGWQKLDQPHQTGEAWLREHCALAEALTQSPLENSPALWRLPGGGALRQALADGLHHLSLLGPMRAVDYSQWFAAWLRQELSPPEHAPNPDARLLILSPIEARMMRGKRVIIGGMNEGIWPEAAVEDGFFSPAMRREIGLPSKEQAIGQQAHDFWRLFEWPEVTITRATHDGSSPCLPSRFWQSLALQQPPITRRDGELGAWRMAWMSMAKSTAKGTLPTPPAPNPPLAARPRRLSAKACEDLMDMPYVFYVRHILGLIPLEEISPEDLHRGFGQWVHKLLDQLVTLDTGDSGVISRSLGREIAAALLLDYAKNPVTQHVWMVRIEPLLSGFLFLHRLRHQDGLHILTEKKGETVLELRGQSLKLEARVDRLELWPTNEVAILDYKTGSIPTFNKMKGGEAWQVVIAGLIAEAGGYGPDVPQHVRELAYWKMPKTAKESAEIVSWELTPGELAAERQKLEEVLTRYLVDDDYVFPADTLASSEYNRPYRHLARVEEWDD